MENLDNGIIRIIGRYWESGKEDNYKVTLKATDGAEAIIKVVKPNQLLTNDNEQYYTESYKLSKDINNKDLIIDEYLIKNGGEKGIPPQLLKGQIFEEAYKNGGHFWPSYRYEPWQDRSFRNQPKRPSNEAAYKAQPYWVDPNVGEGMGTINGAEPIPSNHYNVGPVLNFISGTSYPSSPMKIGDFVANNLKQYYATDKKVKRKFNGAPFYGPNSLQWAWAKLFNYYSIYKESDVEFQSEYFIKIYLRQTYTEYAQTRKAASYGYFQMLYTTAILKENGYPRKPGNYPAPEKLNDQDILTPYVLKHLTNNVIDQLMTNETFNCNNWTKGYEQVLFDSYHLYNPRPDYDDNVFIHTKNFLPR